DFLIDDRVVFGAHNVRILVQHASRGINLAGQQIAHGFYPTSNGSKHSQFPFGLLAAFTRGGWERMSDSVWSSKEFRRSSTRLAIWRLWANSSRSRDSAFSDRAPEPSVWSAANVSPSCFVQASTSAMIFSRCWSNGLRAAAMLNCLAVSPRRSVCSSERTV